MVIVPKVFSVNLVTNRDLRPQLAREEKNTNTMQQAVERLPFDLKNRVRHSAAVLKSIERIDHELGGMLLHDHMPDPDPNFRAISMLSVSIYQNMQPAPCWAESCATARCLM